MSPATSASQPVPAVSGPSNPDTSTVPNQPPRRKRGGQRGNKNALKHGFYAIKPEILDRLATEVKGEGADEIDLLRSLIDQTAAAFNAISNPTLEQCQTTLRGVSQAIDTIKGLHLMQKAVFSNQTTIEKAMAELAALPPEQD